MHPRARRRCDIFRAPPPTAVGRASLRRPAGAAMRCYALTLPRLPSSRSSVILPAIAAEAAQPILDILNRLLGARKLTVRRDAMDARGITSKRRACAFVCGLSLL